MNIPYVFKKCTKCNEWLVACKGNFSKGKNYKFGLSSRCKICDKKYREKNKEHYKKYNEKYYQANKENIKCNVKKYREENKDKIKEYKVKYNEENKEYYKNYNKKYREDNKDKIKSNFNKWYEENKDEVRKKQKKYYEKNKEHYKECRKKYYETDNGQIVRFNSHHKRRVLSDKQGKGITKEQWREMMMFFDWACAYSGILFYDYKNQTRSVDHIVSINKGGVNNIWNLVPMHTPYNSSKNSKEDVMSWYKEQEYFSEERLAKIVEWQQYAYDKWATEEDDELILITDLK